jgi:modulator of FtsH protease HflC
MKNGLFGAALVVLGAVAFLIYNAIFFIYPTQQALVLQFGSVQKALRDPGMYFKIPFIQNVELIERRILDLDLNPQEVIAADQKRLVVDAFARYRIVDPVRFYQSVRTTQGANQRLSTFLQSNLRQVVAESSFSAVVKDSRAALMEKIKGQVSRSASELGVEIVDVRIRRADLPQANSEAVFRRMQTERQREATELRAQGEEASRRIRARAERDREVILAEATRDSEVLRGTGDGERNAIFNDAFGRDPEFFSFYRTMQAYEAGLKSSDTRMVLSPNSDFFRFFGAPNGRPVTPVPAPQ